MHLRDQTVELVEGEMFVVPRGVEHKPEAPEEVQVVLFEPAGHFEYRSKPQRQNDRRSRTALAGNLPHKLGQ